MYAAYQHMTPFEKSSVENRKRFLKERIELYYGLFNEKDALVGWCASFQLRPNELYMMYSAVLPKYRRKGWYTKLAKTTLTEAKKLGFQVVTSNHLATNNSVIIAKLKLGFFVSGLEISDEMGALLRLSYFLNADRAKVIRYRTGQEHPSARVKMLLKLK
jgi:GNAT superfamily N-acetyltransferase